LMSVNKAPSTRGIEQLPAWPAFQALDATPHYNGFHNYLKRRESLAANRKLIGTQIRTS
jgi:hypothetical protein